MCKLKEFTHLGNEIIVELLLSEGADINNADKKGNTPLIAAVKNGNNNKKQNTFEKTKIERLND